MNVLGFVDEADPILQSATMEEFKAGLLASLEREVQPEVQPVEPANFVRPVHLAEHSRALENTFPIVSLRGPVHFAE